MGLPTTVVDKGLVSWTDERLVEHCLRGDEEAWNALIDKYKGLIFSVPVRLGFSNEESAEVFQEVCLSLLAEMSQLREPRALPAWLSNTAWHKCMHYIRHKHRYSGGSDDFDTNVNDDRPLPEALMEELESQQTLRDVIAEMPRRCVELIRMLFFENPPLPYNEVAAKLGLAKGSIGFTRMRCLDQMKGRLKQKGFR